MITRRFVTGIAACAPLLVAAGAILLVDDRVVRLGLLPAAVRAGEIWRLVTGHFVHVDAAHLAADGLGLLLGAVTAPFVTVAGFALEASFLSVAISCCLLAFHPDIEWYVGLSGVAHGTWSAAAAQWVPLAKNKVIPLCVLALLGGKVAYELSKGSLPGALRLPIVYEGHAWGIAMGVAWGAMTSWVRAKRRKAGPAG